MISIIHASASEIWIKNIFQNEQVVIFTRNIFFTFTNTIILILINDYKIQNIFIDINNSIQ